MKDQTLIKAETAPRNAAAPRCHPAPLRVTTGVRAGIISVNHNAGTLRVKTGIKAGPVGIIRKER